VHSSRVALGRAFRRRRLFLTPEETERPELLRELADALDRPREPQSAATAAG
jgi:membrane glycosyltransferase